MSDIRDAGPRLRQMNEILEENKRLRGQLAWTERERDSLRKSIQNLRDYVVEQNCEIELLRSENPSTRRIASEFLRRPYCGQNCVDSKNDAKNDAIGTHSPAKTGTNEPRNGALSDGPDPDSRVWETPCAWSPQATPPQGSVPGEGSVRVSRNAQEPVAWWLQGSEYDTGCEYEYVSLVRESAEAAAKEGGTVTPLYRAPTLTDEEREAVKWAISAAENEMHPADTTLRKLLERLA